MISRAFKTHPPNWLFVHVNYAKYGFYCHIVFNVIAVTFLVALSMNKLPNAKF